MGFVNYLKSLLNNNKISHEDEDDHLKEDTSMLRKNMIVRANKVLKASGTTQMDTCGDKNTGKTSNLVSTTTTTIINQQKVSQIVKSSYVNQNGRHVYPESHQIRIASPIAESSSLYSESFGVAPYSHKKVDAQRPRTCCKCCGRLTCIKLKKNKNSAPLIHFNNFTTPVNVGFCKKRNKYYSAYLHYEIFDKDHIVQQFGARKQKKAKQIGQLRHEQRQGHHQKYTRESLRSSLAPPCCLMNGKPLRLSRATAHGLDASMFTFKSSRLHVQQKLERVHLKKSKAMSNIKPNAYFSSWFCF